MSRGEDVTLPDTIRSAPMVDTQIETDLRLYSDEYVRVTSENPPLQGFDHYQR